MIAHALTFGFLCLGLAMACNVFRLVRGPTTVDRILAFDTLTVNAITLIILFGIRETSDLYFEAALLLAMVGFVSTVAYCKFLLRSDIVE
ncbi:K+/H+ antiporter subunit F [Chondromyces apiculatus]|uniref:Na(+) H(+) antiporter subunit F n=1 Tax=Chondromyces apiculatus DSM 436 TaxID=1192034 RepID=A0A017SYL2_9BACT|nr:K+/H+ antiporter subunit F [Chondromyces apiculatus]EYF01872.1 Na(+) H(+) antiporter subunit F [Chondromyces apiculatus DSM 436]